MLHTGEYLFNQRRLQDCDQEVRQGSQTGAQEWAIQKGNSILIARLVSNLTVHHYMEIAIIGLTAITSVSSQGLVLMPS